MVNLGMVVFLDLVMVMYETKLTTGITDDIPIANEVRPINKAVRYFIKAK